MATSRSVPPPPGGSTVRLAAALQEKGTIGGEDSSGVPRLPLGIGEKRTTDGDESIGAPSSRWKPFCLWGYSTVEEGDDRRRVTLASAFRWRSLLLKDNFPLRCPWPPVTEPSAFLRRKPAMAAAANSRKEGEGRETGGEESFGFPPLLGEAPTALASVAAVR